MPNVLIRPVPLKATRTAWLLWTVGVIAYVIAVLHRTSFGVAGIEATTRFDVSASALSSFTVVQVLVYAALQVPVGLLLDRWGSRRMIAGGALLMASGQLLLAFSTTITPALLARVMVGAGDAMTFISVLKVISLWFPSRQAGLLTQLTGFLGQLGQLLSAIPLVALLHGPGWTTAYVSAAAIGLLAAVLAITVLRDAPSTEPAPPFRTLLPNLRASWHSPGTRLGMWSHCVQTSASAFALMWGYPYLVTAQGLSPTTAGTLLTIFVLATVSTGPAIGAYLSRHPAHHVRVTIAITLQMMAAWTAVLSLPHHAPLWLLTLLVISIAAGGPASMIGFDHARAHNPPSRLGTASGLVNAAGFTAALLLILMIGLVLDHTSPTSTFTPEAFRLAWLTQYPLWLLTLLFVTRTARSTRRFAQLPNPR
ncbi:MFS transporter [Actinocorallia longicatena]|uniref:MFS transporter n=1 Tax=Actinocorallia longicatena TaxID=111803 RepID=A0ABP6QFG6_9ACTN